MDKSENRGFANDEEFSSNTESGHQERSSDLLFEKLGRGKLSKAVKMGMLLSALAFGKPSSAQSEHGPSHDDSTVATEMLPMSSHEDHGDHSKLQWPEAHLTFAKRNPDGTWEFRPDVRSIISPIQLEFGRNVEHTGTAEFKIPYEYSRLFNSAAALRESDHEKVAEYVNQQLRTEMVDALHGWDFNKDVSTWHHYSPMEIGDNGKPLGRQLEATNISVIGLASPEGPASKGPSTIHPDSIDIENIDLARLRAERGHSVTIEQLEKLGVNVDAIAQEADNIGEAELQFTDDEVQELAAVAHAEGLDQLSPGDGGVYELIQNYNDGKLTGAAKQTVDQLVGSKRMVEMAVDFRGQRQEKLIIPLPLLLLLPLALRRRRGKTQPTTPEPIKPTPEPEPTWRDSIPEEIKPIQLPEVGTPDWDEMEEKTYVDDLFVYLDHEKTKSLGIDYRLMADTVQVRRNEFADDAEAQLWLTNEVLTAWRNHDIAARREAGVDQSQLEVGLDYQRQPRQVQWAKMHARGIMDMVRAKEAAPDRDYLELMADQARQLHLRRVERNKPK